MNNNDVVKDKVATLLNGAKNIAIMTSKVAGLDAYCASVGIYHMLINSEKEVTFIYPGKVPEEGKDLINANKITREVKQRNLVVSIDYSDTQASKVNYTTDEGILYLTISPIPPNFNSREKIRSKIAGYDFDVLFIIGAQNLFDLGQIYRSLDKASKTSKIINIDITDRNERFGFVNVVEPKTSSLSLLVLQKATQWELAPDEKTAKALLKGIISKTPPYKD